MPTNRTDTQGEITHDCIHARRCVVAAALLLAACGDSAEESGEAREFNDADVAFAQMMIPHHEQALEMAQLADGGPPTRRSRTSRGRSSRPRTPRSER